MYLAASKIQSCFSPNKYRSCFFCLHFEIRAKCFKFGIKCVSNVLIVQAAGEEVLLGLHFSIGTVWADTALFGQPEKWQPVLVISARLYSQSMVAQSVPRHLLS